MKQDNQGTTILGIITTVGMGQPAASHAEIYRHQGTVNRDHSPLTIGLTGTVLRSAFGAVGWRDMVSGKVRLNILARIKRAN